MKKEWFEGIRTSCGEEKVLLYYDHENEEEIKEVFENAEFKKKLRVILYYVLNGQYEEDHYCHEEVSEKAKGVTAMKLKGKKYGNIRVICREFFQNNKKIVAVSVVEKKTQKVNKKLKDLYERIGGYEYEFQD